MTTNVNSSATVSTKWEVEFFPFKNTYPSKSDFSFGGIDLNKSGTDSGQRIITGIKNLNFTRTKGQIDSLCSFTIIGRPPPNIIAGTWILISSVGTGAAREDYSFDTTRPITDAVKNQEVQGIRRIKFIGQITTVDYIYLKNEKGVLTQQSVFKARPWSHSLNVPVRMDLFSLSNEIKGGIPKLANILSQDKSVSTKTIEELIAKSLNPFELVHTILAAIGAMNQADALSKIDIAKVAGFFNVAVTMPSVPRSLLDRLGFGFDVTPENAFSKGFINVVTGVQQAAVNNAGDWNGVFGQQGNSIPFKAFVSLFNNNPPDRPSTLGVNHIIQSGAPAWQLITTFCDPSVNEFFTDFIYDTNPDGSLSIKPTLFVRDKPFSMRHVENEVLNSVDGLSTKALLSNFTKYDDLPRIRIPSVYIKSISFSNSIINSPNYIRVNFADFAHNPDIPVNLSNLRPPIRLNEEMARFGGNELDVQSNFLGYNDNTKSGSISLNPLSLAKSILSKGFDFPEWVSKVKAALASWYSFDYRMLNGQITIKDDNFALTLGFNLQFKIGKYELVGHIESINTSVNLDFKGNAITETTITLSRIVMVNKDNSLQFIPPEDFGNLANAIPPENSPSIGINLLPRGLF